MNLEYKKAHDTFINCILLLMCISLGSCTEFLDAKPDGKLVQPETLEALQELMDNAIILNRNTPSLGELSCDDFYLTQQQYSSLSLDDLREAYIWSEKNNATYISSDWAHAYSKIYYANTVIENLESRHYLRSQNLDAWNNIMGQALFVRAKALSDAAFIWADVYNPNEAEMKLGIPVPTDTDFNKPTKRESLKDTYNAIISDLELASHLLPERPLHPNRASKPAALGLLARIYLFSNDYENALHYADSCLSYGHKLMDFNDISIENKTFTIPEFNSEIIYYSELYPQYSSILLPTGSYIDSTLYLSYDDNDLRRSIYYSGIDESFMIFRGSYSGSNPSFSGLAIDEMYLIQAECLIRLGNLLDGMESVNYLLRHRFKSHSFIPYKTNDLKEALEFVLDHRRKELVRRGLRWPDIKRLNKEGWGISLRRNIGDQVHILESGDARFILPIPEEIIALWDVKK